jgi:hypothetical protein
LARNIAAEAYLGTECVGHATGFVEETAEAVAAGADLAVVGVDNTATRCVASQYFGHVCRPGTGYVTVFEYRCIACYSEP